MDVIEFQSLLKEHCKKVHEKNNKDSCVHCCFRMHCYIPPCDKSEAEVLEAIRYIEISQLSTPVEKNEADKNLKKPDIENIELDINMIKEISRMHKFELAEKYVSASNLNLLVNKLSDYHFKKSQSLPKSKRISLSKYWIIRNLLDDASRCAVIQDLDPFFT